MNRSGSEGIPGQAAESRDKLSAPTQRRVKQAACHIASLLVLDSRYAKAVAFVSDTSENDEIASMLMQIANQSRTQVQLIKLLIRAEFDANTASKETILRTNSLASKSFGLYARQICKHYVSSHLLSGIRDVVQSPDSLEINPDAVSRQAHIVALPEEERASAIQDAVTHNSSELARCVSQVIEGMSSAAATQSLPPSVVAILKFVGELCDQLRM